MSYEFFPDSSPDTLEMLNQEIHELYEEVEDLHAETGMLMGLMAGSFAYFSKYLLAASQSDQGLSPEECESIWMEAIGRVLSTQRKFDYDLVKEIRDTLGKMKGAPDLQQYFDQAIADLQRKQKLSSKGIDL